MWKNVIGLLFFVLAGSVSFADTPLANPEHQPDSLKDGCSKWIEKHLDKITGDETVVARNSIFASLEGTSGLTISAFKWKDDALNFGPNKGKPNFLLAIVIVVTGGGPCVNEGDGINILFRDGSRATLKNAEKFNCKAKSVVYFRPLWNTLSGNAEELKKLIEKDIEAIRVWTMDSYVEQEFSVQQSDAFKNIMRCLTITTD